MRCIRLGQCAWAMLLLVGFSLHGWGDEWQRAAPVLQRRCLDCHNDRDRKGEISFQSREGARLEDILVAGDADNSYLVEVLTPDAFGDAQMPLQREALSPADLQAIRQWIDYGARWPETTRLEEHRIGDTDWWSLRPLLPPAVPPGQPSWIRTPIDAFVLQQLAAHGLRPSAEADRPTLIRRLFFDLWGLPPDPVQLQRWMSEPGDDWYPRLVEDLLADPRYGERWARHWLDVVHYGDTHGFDKDKVRANAWHYRDYVVRSLNQDKPYATFVQQQIAGDVLWPGDAEAMIATGAIVAGPFDWVGQIEVADPSDEKLRVRNLDRDDMVATIMNTFVSTTVQCARCHNHKFDPVTQRDYYQLQAVFAGVDRADRPIPGADPKADQRAGLRARRAQLNSWIEAAQAQQETHRQLDDQIQQPPMQLQQTADDVTVWQSELSQVERELALLPPEPVAFATASKFAAEGNFQPTDGRPREIFLLQRGDVSAPLRDEGPLNPGAISALQELQGHFQDISHEAGEGAGRAALAGWVTDPRNPLTWRSIVNRVWQYHFGRGLVETANDFGRMGSLPTHPQLLDWMAAEFRDGSQSIKQLHRVIVNSATYRQSSLAHPQGQAVDSDNRFLWRMERRRLDAEQVRDAVLAVAGKLDLTMYGPGFRAFQMKDDHSPHYDYLAYDPNSADAHRRSIYRFIVRSVPDPFFQSLDCADPTQLTARRIETLTALQALSLLNDKFMVCMSEHFAERVAAEADSLESQIQRAYWLALSRGPTPEEVQRLVPVASEHSMATVCRVLLNCNEFIFVD